MKNSQTRGAQIVRNTVLNIMGNVLLILIAIATTPFVVRGLGVERFGLLSLVWVVVGYFSFFDLGLGKTTTKFVADALARGEEQKLPGLVWTAVVIQSVLGFVGMLILTFMAPLLVESILNIPSKLIVEAEKTFHILALSVPLVVVSTTFRGMLEADQQFSVVNAVKVPTGSLMFLLPLLGALLGWDLPPIVALLVIVRGITLVSYLIFCFRSFPALRNRFLPERVFLRPLLVYGGWVTLSGVMGSALFYLDRILIGALLTMSALAYYVAPYDAVTRLWIIPLSLGSVVFPAFSELKTRGDWIRLEILFARSVKYLLLAIGTIAAILLVFARDVLRIWLGSDFAQQSTLVLQILAIAVLLNSLAGIPHSLLMALGRADLTAKFYAVESPIYMVGAWFLISRWGITGAATAWSLVIAVDTCLLYIAVWRLYQLSPRIFIENGSIRAGVFLLALTGTVYGIRQIPVGTQFQLTLFILICSVFLWVVWRRVLDAHERIEILEYTRIFG